MAVFGIVTEFNPFHNGHLHFINEIKKTGDCEGIICVMSGNFVQRGEPAICEKWARAEMAIKCGVDLVIELPSCFSFRSAYHFARGALHLLDRTGIVTHIAFGSESGDLKKLQHIASFLAHEPYDFRQSIKKHLAQGVSFPVARSKALQEKLGFTVEELHDLIQSPNNILGIEYLHVMIRDRLQFEPVAIHRIGSGYHDETIHTYASASGIRHALCNDPALINLQYSMPDECWTILQRELDAGRSPISYRLLEQALLIKLRTISAYELSTIYEISEGLEFRIKDAADMATNLDELRHLIKSKRYSFTRINRTLLYILFNLTKNLMDQFDQVGPHYLHILGFSSKGKNLLQRIKFSSKLKLINRGKDMKYFYNHCHDQIVREMLRLDINAGNVYSLLFSSHESRKGGRDFTHSPVILD